VQVASLAEVQSAVSMAKQGQPRWNMAPFSDRARVVKRFHDKMLDARDRVLDTIQAETGKARRDALAEVISVAGTARYYLKNGEDHLRPKQRQPAVPAITAAEIHYKPHGVTGLITPWNYPFLLSIADAIPALLAGNAVVVKPSELTPLSAVLARELFIECGLDPNLLHVVHGGADIAGELIRHVDYVGFTGGTETGRKVAVAAAERLIPFSLELGGKNPMIVLAGASLEDATAGLIAGAFSNSGQTCIAVERVYVQEPVYEAFVRRLAQRTSQLRLGWSHSWDIDMGSLISVAHAKKVLSRIERAAADGARIVCGGGARTDLGPSFVEPTILTGAGDEMQISKEETFGPVVSIYPFRTTEEAIRRANDSVYGLNASVWARGQSESREVGLQLETGSVAINSTLLIYNSFDVPMGGIKLSGIGRRHGEHGILRYTQAQSIVSSIARGGGYDSTLMRIRNERIAKMMVAALKLWRKL
jgi:succinate-semialdehyde dehydrogenase/glutarate-semialdehyde dehydrogenase